MTSHLTPRVRDMGIDAFLAELKTSVA
eukprot:SAG25_NODE_3425_length_1086_cov_0.777102_1_plen_26_part_10